MDYRSGAYGSASTATTAEIDQGLRTYMLGIFNRMAVALALTGIVAWWGSTALLPLMASPFWIVIALVPLAFILVLSFGVNKLSTGAANVLFWAFAVAMGLSMSTIFVRYTSASIAQVFFITASTFAAASLYGYTTKKDLTNVGTFLIMGAIGIMIASIVNLFLASSLLTFVISVIGVVVFTGLTAYDTQNIKADYLSQGEVYGFESAAKSSIYGALSLYLNFVNIFNMLLSLIGQKNE